MAAQLRLFIVSLVWLLAATAPVYAAIPKLDVQLLKPVAGGTGFISVESGNVNPHLHMTAGFYLNYAHRPLEVRYLDGTSADERIGTVITHRLDFGVTAAIGLIDLLEIGLAMPVAWQSGYESQNFQQANVQVGGETLQLGQLTQGDMRLIAKVRLFGGPHKKWALALLDTTTIPAKSDNSYATDGSLTFERGLAFSIHPLNQLRFAGTVAFRSRERTEIQTLVIDDELVLKSAIGYTLPTVKDLTFEAIGEIIGHTGVQRPFELGLKAEERILRGVRTSFEADIGGRACHRDGYCAVLSFGTGLSRGYGAPLVRVFTGASYNFAPSNYRDRDNDGVPDRLDSCVDLAEDKDGFADSDGCPEHDNDNDGIPDACDACPSTLPDDPEAQSEACRLNKTIEVIPVVKTEKCQGEVEDFDGYQDEDGCPDPDNDQDGIIDALDLCRNTAEDLDGQDDEDGCPEMDLIEDAAHTAKPSIKANHVVLAKVVGNTIVLAADIEFETGSAILRTTSVPVLKNVGQILELYPHIRKIRIEGHTDSRGLRRDNIQLGKARAHAVRDWLIAYGIAAGRLHAVGVGPDRPLRSNSTEAGREENRRVEIWIVEQDDTQQKVPTDIQRTIENSGARFHLEVKPKP